MIKIFHIVVVQIKRPTFEISGEIGFSCVADMAD